MSGEGGLTFECVHCGGGELVLPDHPADASIVQCGSCGRELTDWATLRAHIHEQAFSVVADKANQVMKLRKI